MGSEKTGCHCQLLTLLMKPHPPLKLVSKLCGHLPGRLQWQNLDPSVVTELCRKSGGDPSNSAECPNIMPNSEEQASSVLCLWLSEAVFVQFPTENPTDCIGTED